MTVMRGFLSIALLTATFQLAAQPAWVGTWGASPLPPTPGGGFFPATPSFENVTIRQVVRISAGGDQLRLRLSNEYGTQALTIGAATVALADGEAAIRAGSQRTVTFSGSNSAVIPAGSPLLSDPIDLSVDELAEVSISIWFPEDTGQCTCHQVGLQTGFVSESGDFTGSVFDAQSTIQERAFISGVEVLTDEAAGVVVALGDSITDGVGSTAATNSRWPDMLAERLAARRGASFGVINHGISGNRVLADGAGQSAIARLDRDVLSVPGVTHVVVFEGVNDLGIGFGNFGDFGGGGLPAGIEVSTESMIAGYRQIIARARAKGLRVYGATIAPYEGASYFSDEGERVRQAVNAWMRDSAEFDAVLDFDAVLRDAANPSRMADGLHSGDFLHGSDAGYEAMAQSIDLKLFR